jgi:predicted transcriptional regulator
MKKTATGKTRLWTQVMARLLEGDLISEAGAKYGVTERTVLNWLAEPEKSKQYASLQSQLLEGTVNLLRSGGRDSVHALHEIVVDTKASRTERTRAADRLLQHLLRATEIQDLVKRLDKLEVSMKDGER